MIGAMHPKRSMTNRLTMRPGSQWLKASVLLALGGTLMLPIYAEDSLPVHHGGPSTKRMPLHTVMPDYPKIARRDRIEGEVQVCFDITREGRTRRIAVRKSTNRLFEKSAMRAIRASTYVALPKDAEVPGIKACRTFRFTLEPVVVEAGK